MRPGVKIFVEGGGNGNSALKSECKQAFHELFVKAGLGGCLPQAIPCGSRQRAFEQFETASLLARPGSPRPLLLVDAEALVTEASPWEHVRRREGDQWIRPPAAGDDDLHFMVVCMESWLVADRRAFCGYFVDAHEGSLPQRPDTESVPKEDLFRALRNATIRCAKKEPYDDKSKGKHSFNLLARVDPAELRGVWARRFFAELRRRSGVTAG